MRRHYAIHAPRKSILVLNEPAQRSTHAHCTKIMSNYFFSLQCVKSSSSMPKSSDLQRKLPDEPLVTRSLVITTEAKSPGLPRTREGRHRRAETGHRRPGQEVLLLHVPRSRGRHQNSPVKQHTVLRMSPTVSFMTLDQPRLPAVKPVQSPPSSCQLASTKPADQQRNAGMLTRCTSSL